MTNGPHVVNTYVTGCGHGAELAALRQTVAELTAERDAARRELTDVKVHRAVIHARLTELTHVLEARDKGLARVPPTTEEPS